VYLFAPYLSVMKPYATGKGRWRLEWCEPDEEVRWGELKSTPQHVTTIEDTFPHAWAILRASGLSGPLELRRVDLIDPWSVRLHLRAGEVAVELIFDRHAGFRRRYLAIETDSVTSELDFSTEPGVLKVNRKAVDAPPWNPQMRPLALELSAFLALMQEATKSFLDLQAAMIAGGTCDDGCTPGLARALFEALCREAAMAGLRVSENSGEGRALVAAAQGFIWRNEDVFPELSSELASIVRRSPFLARVRKSR